MNAFFLLFFASYGIYALFHNITFWLIYIILVCLYYFITEHSLGKGINDFIRRKISIATWSNSFDPQMYTDFKLDITKIEPYLEKKSQELNEHITLTIFSIKLMSIVLKKHPEIYGYIKFGKYIPKEGVDICCLVQVGDGKELANTTIKNCETKSFVDISRELKENVALLRKRKNRDQVKKMNLMKMFPTWCLGPIQQCLAYLSSIGLALKFIGLKSFEFGSCVITSIGGIGIEDSSAPIPALTFAPMLLTICKKTTKLVFDEDGKVNQKKFMKFNFTSDFRFFELKAASQIIEEIHRIGENPVVFEEECEKYLKKVQDKKSN